MAYTASTIGEADMSPELLKFMQDRMATAYREQLWAVTIIAATNAFIATHAAKLLGALPVWLIYLAAACVSLLALAFVWSRHFIYVHYDECAKTILAKEASEFCPSRLVTPFRLAVTKYSGVTLYSLIIVGLLGTAISLVAAAGTVPAR